MKKQLLTTFDYLIMWRLYVVIFKTHLDYYYLCVSCIQVKRTFLAKKLLSLRRQKVWWWSPLLEGNSIIDLGLKLLPAELQGKVSTQSSDQKSLAEDVFVKLMHGLDSSACQKNWLKFDLKVVQKDRQLLWFQKLPKNLEKPQKCSLFV